MNFSVWYHVKVWCTSFKKTAVGKTTIAAKERQHDKVIHSSISSWTILPIWHYLQPNSCSSIFTTLTCSITFYFNSFLSLERYNFSIKETTKYSKSPIPTAAQWTISNIIYKHLTCVLVKTIYILVNVYYSYRCFKWHKTNWFRICKLILLYAYHPAYAFNVNLCPESNSSDEISRLISNSRVHIMHSVAEIRWLHFQ